MNLHLSRHFLHFAGAVAVLVINTNSIEAGHSASSAGSGAARTRPQVQIELAVAADFGSEQRRFHNVDSAQVAGPTADAEFEEKTGTFDSPKSTNRGESSAEAHPKRRQTGAATAVLNGLMHRRNVEPERITPREFIAAWQSSSSIAEVSKKTGIRKKAVRVRAYRYRKVGIPLKEFPPVEWPDWDELAEYATSLVPKKAVSMSAGKGGQGGEDRAGPPTAVEVEESAPVARSEAQSDPASVEEKESAPAAVEGEEDSPAPVGEAEPEPAARDDDVQVGDAQSERDAHDPSSEASSEKTAFREAELPWFLRPASGPFFRPRRLCPLAGKMTGQGLTQEMAGGAWGN